MLAEQWQRLRAAYDAVMDAPASDRPRLLEELSGSDPAIASELGKLLAVADDEAFLATPLARLAPPPLSAETVLCGRFVLLRRIGRGGMGEVWAAHDRTLKEDVAIKIVRQDITDTQAMRRVTREIQLARRISHPNVCRVNELFEDTSTTPPRSFLTMELLDGETLAARLARDGSMPPGEALEIFRLLVAGVSAAHEADVIHRDLKPANIMLLGDNRSRGVAVMDFGLAREPVRIDADGTTAVGALLGTPAYMSPEQVSGGPVTPATDIYALGLILFEMLRGRRPFEGSNTLDSWMRRAREGPQRLSGVMPGVEARIDAVIGRCLEYQPERRYQSAAALLKALDRSFYIAVPRSRRFWVPAAAAVAAVIVAVSLVAWNSLRPELPPPQVLQWYEEAQQALAEGASVRALNAINRAIELAPWFAPSHALLAEVQLELDMPGRAQESMLRANEVARERRRIPSVYLSHMDGIQALLQHDCQKAIDALTQAADMGEPVQRPFRMITTARAIERCDRPDEALALMKEAAQLDPRNAAVPLRSARIAAGRRDYASAYTYLDTAEGLFRDRNNVEGRGEVLTLRGAFQVAQDRLQDAEATLATAADLAANIQDVRQTIRTRLQQAIMQRKRGDVAAAAQLTADAIDLGRRNGLEALTLEGLMTAGNVHLVRNQFADAQSLYERALTIAEVHRHDEFIARVRLSLASGYVQTLRPDLAAVEIRSSRPYYESINHTRNLSLLDALSGQVKLAQMEYDAAIQQFGGAVAHAIEIGDAEQELTGRENLATALGGAGRYTEALDEYRRVRERHESSGRVRGATFAALNIIDLLSRLGRFREAASVRVPAIDEGARELRAQTKRIAATAALREGRYPAARQAALESLELGANLSPERLARAALTLCLASAAMRKDAQEACAAADRRIGDSSHPAIRLESRLALAEARLALSGTAAAAPLLAEAGGILRDGSTNEHRWRFLALSAAIGADVEGTPAREHLTRELDRLRLLWGEENFESWTRRADVAAPLNIAGDER